MKFSNSRLILVGIVLCSVFAGVQGAGKTYWISPKPLAKENGTRQYPFHSIEKALEIVGPGNTFLFVPGIYAEQIRMLPASAGTPQNPTVLKSEKKYMAVMHGSLGHGIFVDRGTEWVIIDGFEVRCASNDGIKSNADHNVIRNCWVHNNLSQGIAAHKVKGSVIERNLIEFNGRNIQHEHGIYADGVGLTIRQNIVRYNAGKGMALYPEISESLIENNLIYKNSQAAIILYCPKSGGGNRILNNTIADNGYSLTLMNAYKEIFANNIFAYNTHWPYLGKDNDIITRPDGNLKASRFIHNIYYPKSKFFQGDNLFKDPIFVHRSRGIYFPRVESPSFKKGDKEYASKMDFFGNPRLGETADIGCFQYSEKLYQSQSRDQWSEDWPFINITTGQTVIPDLWADTNN